MQIRPLAEPDISALARLMAATPLWQRYGVTEASATARLQAGLAQAATILVAAVADEPAAGFLWYVQRGAFQRSGYIMLVGVQPTVRGQGVGTALMRQAEALMFAERDSICLLVSDFNEPAQRFYQRLGYAQVGMLPDYVIPGVNEYLYYKRKAQKDSS
jgi:ribosomal protein S18 acetylase RimI-like enzyme